MESARTYHVVTYGCQMNAHDSERLRGLLEAEGLVRSDGGPETADVVVFNTCAVRENADNRLYGNLGHLASVKAARPGMQIAVGGCMAQKDRETVLARAPWVDVVFGTHNMSSLPGLLERARSLREAQIEIVEALEVFPSELPARREAAGSAWVSISVGCDNTCTFCIVPALRGRKADRPEADVLAEVEMLVGQGVAEVTLLGQNVNAYNPSGPGSFARLLRACGRIEGLERVRFTSPHPRDFTDDVIEAMAETPNVMPQLHLPLQSGSDKVLRAMRRSYRRDRFFRIVDSLRAAMPDAAISTDVIVGFPGETEADFADTLDAVERVRFQAAYTFVYSPRPNTPAAAMEQVPREVAQERYERLAAIVQRICWEENRAFEGREVEVMFCEGDGRKNAATGRLSARARDNRLVHVKAADDSGERPRPGDLAWVRVTHAAPHHLNADAGWSSIRRTAAGDAWARANAPAPRGVSLPSPSVRV